MFSGLEHINGFSVRVDFPRFIGKEASELRDRWVDRLYSELYAVCKSTGLYAHDRIVRFASEGEGEESQAGVAYEDDPFEFRISVTSEQALHIVRKGSTFERFYSWYTLVMPHLSNFILAVQQEYEAFLREKRGTEFSIAPSFAAYRYSFILYDFTIPLNGGRRKKVRNTELLRQVLTHVPGSDGALVELSNETAKELGRVDVSISRWNTVGDNRIRQLYGIEAPANRDYGALWLNFSYIAETSDSEVLPRKAADMEPFLQRPDLPLNDFLQIDCISNFLGTLMKDTTFRSTAGTLP